MNGKVSESSPLRMVKFVPSTDAQLTDAVRVATSLFDGNNVHAVMRQTIHCIHADFDTTAAGNAVKDDGQTGRARNGMEMLK